MPAAISEPTIQALMERGRELSEGQKLPDTPFDASGAWKQTYAIWESWQGAGAGWLTLEKQAPHDGAFDFEVDWRLKQNAGDFQHVHARLNCSCNELATPRRWRLDCKTEAESGRPIHELTSHQEANVNQGVIELSTGRRRFADKPLKDWTCNWSVLEAVQRLQGSDLRPLSFTLLDFLDIRKDQQTLAYQGTQDIALDGQTRHLCGYRHIGYGLLPWEYWLDEQHRLVLAKTSLYCLLAIERELTP